MKQKTYFANIAKRNKIVATLLERLGILVPQYQSFNHPEMGKVEIIPLQFWRRLPLLNRVPYFVGDKISFIMKIEKVPEDTYNRPAIFERFKDEESFFTRVEKLDSRWEGNPIPREGDIEYTYGRTDTPHGRYTLISAKAMNTDQWAVGCVAALGGAILSIVVGIILGFIQVEPFWRVWIPK